MTNPLDLQGKLVEENRRQLVIEKFRRHQHPVRDTDLDDSRNTLKRCIVLYRSIRKSNYETEKINIPQTKKAICNDIAKSSLCKKVRLRERLEERIRLSVSKIISQEWLLNKLQRDQQDCYKRYMELSMRYARLSCRQLCDQIQVKLPRELRDLICQYVVGRTSVVLAPPSAPQSHRVALSHHHNPDEANFSSVSADYPFFWLEEEAAASQHIFSFAFVGYDTLSELAETWYQATTFITSNVTLLPLFVSVDPWLMFLDVRKFLRKVVVRIPESSIQTLAVQVQPFLRNGQNYFRIATVMRMDGKALMTQLAHLTLFGSLTKVLLHIVPGQDYVRNSNFLMSPVEVWQKHHYRLISLLDGLQEVWEVLAEYEEQGPLPGIKLCLDIEGKCVLNKRNTVWSPLGCLEQILEYGYEQEARVKAAS